MASGRGRAVEAGRASVRFIGDRTPLQRALRLAERDLKTFGNRVGTLGRSITAAATATLAAFTVPVTAAVRLEEVLAGLTAAFGRESGAALEFLDSITEELKLARAEAAAALTGFQQFFRGMGFGAEEAATLSQEITRITADLVAAADISFDEAAGRIRSALTGSTKVLDQFGVNIKEAAIDAESFALGINKASRDLDAYEKATVIASLITKQFASNGILGAAQREAEGAAGQFRALANSTKNLATQIGTVVLPVITPLINKITELVGILSDWAEQNKTLIISAVTVAAKLAALGVSLTAVAAAAKATAFAIGAVRSAILLLETTTATGLLIRLSALAAGLISIGAAARVAESQTKLSFSQIKREIEETQRELDAIEAADQRNIAALRPLTPEEQEERRPKTIAELFPESEIGKASQFRTARITAIGRAFGNVIANAGDQLKQDAIAAGDALTDAAGKARLFFDDAAIILLENRLRELRETPLVAEVATSFSNRALRESFGIGTNDIDQKSLDVQEEIRDTLKRIEDKEGDFVLRVLGE